MADYFKFYWNHKALNKLIIIGIILNIFILFNILLRYPSGEVHYGMGIVNLNNILFSATIVCQLIGIIQDAKSSNQIFIHLFVDTQKYILMQIIMVTLIGYLFFAATDSYQNGTIVYGMNQVLSNFLFVLMIPILVSKGIGKSILFIIKTIVVLSLTTALLLIASAEQALTSGTLIEVLLFIMTSAYMLKNFFNSVAGGYYE